ncbi:origin recognition complex subunit 6 [Plodia interpunctella]|uniref:origin recognition complex subunit 6 n=1 Tax=Plodia interpunctella TaxID=58824 RepID=UPI002367D67A|nr:origin recognition complex subunit 6 [Plodia interpunctella]
MSVHNKTLTLIASKLGISDKEKLLNKAAEFERLLQMRNVAGSNMTDTSKVVICLDLAANVFGIEFDVKAAIKYSGLKPTMYTNCRKVVVNLLELNSDRLTVSTLCVTLQCASVQELADNILEEYQKQAKVELDLDLPQYVCMAVSQACRLSKVKVPKTKLIEKSRLKPAQWGKLDADWTKFVDDKFAVAKKKRGRPAKTAVVDETEQESMEIEEQKIEIQEPQTESYEDWKRRMLEAAYKELALLEQTQKIEKVPTTPRRSPRKTPQKFSPYKSPGKKNGVRLLFPLNI